MTRMVIIGTKDCPAMCSDHGRTPRVSTTAHAFTPGDAGTGRDPWRRTVDKDLLATNVDLITVQKVLGHASVPTTVRDDRRGERVKKQAVGILQVPYRS